MCSEVTITNMNEVREEKNIIFAEDKIHNKRKIIKKDEINKVKRVKNDTRHGMIYSGNSDYTNSSTEDNDYILIVSNLPNWNYKQFKDYIEKECGPVDEIQLLKKHIDSDYFLKLSFPRFSECERALSLLKDKQVEGKSLIVVMEDASDTGSETSVATEIVHPCESYRPALDEWDIDPRGRYGLKLSFLNSLEITPPIDKWVHVVNFRCDKSELRDVMELAGHVVHCSVFTIAGKYAKVMYSHPLEAVQAVSMLNGQMFYGKPLKVTMDRTPSDTVVLPKGLANVGAGLGLHGKPLRNILTHYQRYLKRKPSEANTFIFDRYSDNSDVNEPDTKDLDIDIKQGVTKRFKVIKAEELNKYEADKQEDSTGTSPDIFSNKSYSPNPVEISPRTEIRHVNQNIRTIVSAPANGPDNIRPQFCPVGNRQGPGPNINFTPVRPNFPGNYAPGPRFGPGPSVRPHGFPGTTMVSGPMPVSRHTGPQMHPGSMSSTVQMSNLPPNTTFPLLCDKLSRCGQVLSLQMTTPGCAVVRFSQQAHAQMCYQNYNGCNVDGYVIGVSFI